jgi:hypothetical protein
MRAYAARQLRASRPLVQAELSGLERTRQVARYRDGDALFPW